jgi:hypothetical protein
MNPLHYFDICRVLCFEEFLVSARNYESMPGIERHFDRDRYILELKARADEEMAFAIRNIVPLR